MRKKMPEGALNQPNIQSRQSQPIALLLPRLIEESKRLYGSRLLTLAVFGSVGRGTATGESDVDVLIVAENLPQGRVRRVSEFEQIEKNLQGDFRILQDAGIHSYISPVIKTPGEVLAGSPLFLDMIFDAWILIDKERFFSDFLQSFKRRLDKLGARRVVEGDRWYWDLKPDYRPGEIFEL